MIAGSIEPSHAVKAGHLDDERLAVDANAAFIKSILNLTARTAFEAVGEPAVETQTGIGVNIQPCDVSQRRFLGSTEK